MKEKYDVVIIGAGPAGLSAGLYGARAGLSCAIVEKAAVGGLAALTSEIENYPGVKSTDGFSLSYTMMEQCRSVGAEFIFCEATGITPTEDGKLVTLADGNSLECKNVIITAGASPKKLNVKGEREYLGKGVSYCATCDGAFFKKRDVAVVGGGDVAVEDAVYLSRFCRKVYLIHRRDSLRAAKSLQEKLFSCENVEVIWNSTLQRIQGTDLVEGICIRQNGEDTERELAVEGVFIAVGMRPNTEAYRGTVACDEGGYLLAGEDCATDVPGIFAAGDIRTKALRQIVTAVADGACAVASVERYLCL